MTVLLLSRIPPSFAPRRFVLRVAAALLALPLAATAGGATEPEIGCVQAGHAAALTAGLPKGLLPAVGRVESGRADPVRGDVVPWPWTIDVAGQGRFFPDKQSAIDVTHALLAAGQHNIDVGCYQISLLNHPLAFSNLDDAFDPTSNADYAARFLASLRARYGNWADAVAAYHSADPARGTPYRNLVFAAWQPASNPLPGPALFSSVPSVHVWSPSPVGTAPRIISLNGRASSALRLPHILTPDR